MSRIKPDSRELLHRIAKLSSEAEWTADEAREALVEAGLHPEDSVEAILRFITLLKEELRVPALAARIDVREKTSISAEATALTRQQLLDKLREAISQLPAPAAEKYAAALGELEEASESDLRSMLEQLANLAGGERGRD